MDRKPQGMPTSLFGARLRMLRRKAKWTQQVMADRLSIHRTTYTKYETGVVTPDHQGLVSLAALYGVTVDYLLGREDGEIIVTDNGGEKMRLSLQEQQLLQLFRQLGYAEQQELVQQVQKSYAARKK